MRLKEKKYMPFILGIEIIVLVVLFFINTLDIFNVSVENIFKFFICQITIVLLPGMAFLSFIPKRKSIILNVCLAYILGYGFNIIEYFIAELLERTIPHAAIGIFFALNSVLIVFRNRKNIIYKRNEIECQQELLILTILLIMFFFNVFAFSMTYKNEFSVLHDFSWWENNSVALKLKYQPDNLFMSGTTLKYHYFSSIQIAFFSLVSGIDIVELSVPFYAVCKTIIMVGATGYLIDIFNIEYYQKIIGYIIILFTTGWEKCSVVTYFHHILLCPFGFDIGYAFGIIFLGFMYEQWKEEKLKISWLVLTNLTWVVCVGAKAPIASVLLLAPGLICVYWLFKKRIKKSIIYGGTILGNFLIISILCVGMLDVASEGTASYYLQFHSIEDLKYFNGNSYPLIIAIFMQWVCLNPALTVLAILCLCAFIVMIRKKMLDKNQIVFGLTMIFTYIFGMILWRIIKADGSSEMYYGMAAFIPLYYLALLVIMNMRQRTQIHSSKKIKNIMKCMILMATVIGTYRFMFFAYSGTGAVRMSLTNLKNYVAIVSVDTSDMDGLRWIRDNTSTDALIVSDDAVMTGEDTNYAYGIVSERQQYLEGSHMLRFGDESLQAEIGRREKIISLMYNNDVEALKQLEEEGVDYIVQTVSITPQFVANMNYLELVAESKNIRVYRYK